MARGERQAKLAANLGMPDAIKPLINNGFSPPDRYARAFCATYGAAPHFLEAAQLLPAGQMVDDSSRSHKSYVGRDVRGFVRSLLKEIVMINLGSISAQTKSVKGSGPEESKAPNQPHTL